MVKIYTRKGDEGTTSLYSGERVLKTDPIIEAVGTLDELQSHIGVLKTISNCPHWVLNDLEKIQRTLIDISSNLATTEGTRKNNLKIEADLTTWLEETIDRLTEDLTPLTKFILQGTDNINAQAHVCRSVSRKAERRVLEIKNEDVDPNILSYLNRLSDYFFTLARWFSNYSDRKEIPYKKKLYFNEVLIMSK